MRVLMLSWEYPPRVIGGLARHVYAISTSLASKNVSLNVITIGDGQTQGNKVREERLNNNLLVTKINGDRFMAPTFLDWVYQFNATMIEAALSKIDVWKPELIHAHDWLVAPSAIALKHLRCIPLLSTIHSTELGRSGSLKENSQKHILEMESFLIRESSKIIVTSNYMKKETSALFGLSNTRIQVISNGIEKVIQKDRLDLQAVRRRYALPWEKLVIFVGRMFEQKGPHLLLDAALQILQKRQDFKFVFVGEGPLKSTMQKKANEMNIGQKVYFTGFIPDSELHELYTVADVAVFPSLYEPFGIVCLEAMAAGCPVIAANVGGLAEIIEDGKTGMLVSPNDSVSINSAILKVSDNGSLARHLSMNAREHVLYNYRWDKIAEGTLGIYRSILDAS
jgi:glycosyltransferase involved in cell wall biosynthesis